MIFCFWLLIGQQTYAVAIKITTVSQIDFGNGAPGDAAKQVLPSTTDNATNASFNVTGDPNRAFTIGLPATAINMQTGAGATLDTISVSTFSSFPTGPATLDATGKRTLLVGATRAALRLTQRAGLYSGSYSITVVY